MKRILDRMASAPFDQRVVSVRMKHRGLTYEGHPLGAREPSLRYHLMKRVLVERQWPEGTTTARYVDAITRATRVPEARLIVYRDGARHVAATVTPTSAVVALAERGELSLPELVVI